DSAVAQLDHALRLSEEQLARAGQPRAPLAPLFRERARLNLQRRQPAAALRDFEKAIALSRPNESEEDHLECGLIRSGARRFPEAVGEADAALGVLRAYPAALRLRGETLLELKR